MRAPLLTPRRPRRFGSRGPGLYGLVAVLAGTLAGALPVQGQGEATGIFELVPVERGVWLHVTRPGISPSAYANSVIVAGDSAVLVVDTHHSAAAGQRLARQIRRLTNLPVRWVVNSHYHGDHVWGNVSVAAAWPQARFLAHPATIDSILNGSSGQLASELERLDDLVARLEAALASDSLPADVVPTYRRTLARYRAQRREVAATSVFLPDTEVSGELRVQLGGREVWIRHPGPAHTAGDLVVWIPDVGVLAAGDLVEQGALWLQGGDVRGWARALASLRTLQPRTVLASHARLRDDAFLLEAHTAFLVEAVALASAGMPSSIRGTARVLEKHRSALARIGVTSGAFREYVAAVLEGVRPTGR